MERGLLQAEVLLLEEVLWRAVSYSCERRCGGVLLRLDVLQRVEVLLHASLSRGAAGFFVSHSLIAA
jgi:hypothetical protein